MLGGLHVHVGWDLINLQGLFQGFKFTFRFFEKFINPHYISLCSEPHM